MILFTTIIDDYESYRQDLADVDDRKPEDVTDDELYSYINDCIKLDWDSVKDDIDYYDDKHPNSIYRVEGMLGLWDGKHEIIPKDFKTLIDAVTACIGNDATQDVEIEEDDNGCLHVHYHHHDGTNNYQIYEVVDDIKQNINLTKEIW